MAEKILILNGPNLNMLGTREPEIYGSDSLDDVRALCEKRARELSLEIDFRQSNSEADLIEWIQGARGAYAGIILNAGALTHTSVALLDALLASQVPAIEVHLSNIFRRESYRRQSYVSEAARGLICGFGAYGYALALDAHRRLLGPG